MEDNLSSGRKIFRFLKFFEELNALISILKLKKKKIEIRILTALTHIAAFGFYLLDNIVWFSSIGVLGKYIVANLKWKKTKDIFSLCRCIFDMLKILKLLYNRKKKEALIMETLTDCPEEIIRDKGLLHVLLRKLIISRRKCFFLVFDLIKDLQRIIVLTNSLQLPGYHLINPIFIALCGVLSSFLSVMKTIYKKNFIKLDRPAKQEQELVIYLDNSERDLWLGDSLLGRASPIRGSALNTPTDEKESPGSAGGKGINRKLAVPSLSVS